MNSDILTGKWKQLRGEVKAHWGKLTDDDLDVIDGNFERLAGKVQEVYGDAREAISAKVKDLVDKVQKALEKHDKPTE